MKGSLKIVIPILISLLLIVLGIRLYLSEDIREKQSLLDRVSAQLSQTRQSEINRSDEDSKVMLEDFIKEYDALFYPELIDEDLIRIGLELSETVRGTGNEIKSYNLVSKNGHDGYHYQLDTNMSSLLKLIRILSGWSLYLRIENLTIHASPNNTSASLVISPVLRRSSEKLSEDTLTMKEAMAFIRSQRKETIVLEECALIRSLFNFPIPQAEPFVAETVHELPPSPPAPRMLEAPAWLNYVGMSVNGNNRLYYILDKRTNRTFELHQGEEQSHYQLVQVNTDRIILMIDGEERFVYK